MNQPQPIFNEDEAFVRISQAEYLKLLEYKAICQDIYKQFLGDADGL